MHHNKQTQILSAAEAVKHIHSGFRVFLHGSASTPVRLIQELLKRKAELKNVELVSITLQGLTIDPQEIKGHFFINSLFVSDAVRAAVNSESGCYIPMFLSEIPALLASKSFPIDVAIIHVSPPDKHGYCSLGTSVDIAKAAVQHAKVIIAQVNPNMPRVHGDAFIPFNCIDFAVEVDDALPEVSYEKGADPVSEQIGKNVASLVEDGATLQLGIGVIPDQVLKNLTHCKHLGLHTEMFSDGVIPLIESGVMDNSRKKVVNGYCVTSFLLGTKKLYDFVDDHPYVKSLEIGYVNDPRVISLNKKVTAINSAIEIDITGQVCSDSIGTYQYSGIGGQMDFIRGAALSEGGKPIIALPSMTAKGVSRIVPLLNTGAGVVTTRGHVHWVATEFGVVNLCGKNLEQRAKLLIDIAHPSHREVLEKAYAERFR